VFELYFMHAGSISKKRLHVQWPASSTRSPSDDLHLLPHRFNPASLSIWVINFRIRFTNSLYQAPHMAKGELGGYKADYGRVATRGSCNASRIAESKSPIGFRPASLMELLRLGEYRERCSC
jgi:hypothetical protein